MHEKIYKINVKKGIDKKKWNEFFFSTNNEHDRRNDRKNEKWSE